MRELSAGFAVKQRQVLIVLVVLGVWAVAENGGKDRGRAGAAALLSAGAARSHSAER